MTLQYIEEQVARVLRDVKPNVAPAPALRSNEDVVASEPSLLSRRSGRSRQLAESNKATRPITS